MFYVSKNVKVFFFLGNLTDQNFTPLDKTDTLQEQFLFKKKKKKP